MKRSLVWLTLGLLLGGCAEELPPIDVDVQAARLTGIEHAIVFSGANSAGPQPPADKGDLSEQRAVFLALRHDPRILSAMDDVRVAEANANQARLLPNPILNIDVRLPEGGMGKSAIEIIPTEDLIAILEKPRQVRAADNRLREAIANAMTVVLDEVAEVRRTYATAQSLDEEIADANDRVSEAKRLQQLAGARLKAGEGMRLDVLTFQASAAQAEADLADLKLERSAARFTLARLIGQARSAAEWRLSQAAVPAAPEGESAWVNAALANRPEILAKRWELAALGEEVHLADLTPLEGDQVGGYAQRDPTWEIGPTLTIPIPIFDFGQAARARARAMQSKAKHDLDEQSLEVIEEVRLDYATYRASVSALTVAREQLLPLQQQEYQQAELAYTSGDADLAALLAAGTDLRSVRGKLTELKEKAIVALVNLERAAGGAGVAATLPGQSEKSK